MYYKLIKEMPKHDIGDIIYIGDIGIYEWLDSPNYLLPKDVVEECSEYFQVIDIDWEIGEIIYFIDSFGNIINHIFHPKNHIKYVINKNAFRDYETALWVSDKYKKLLGDEITIIDTDKIIKLISLLNMSINSGKKKNIDVAVDMLKKMIK